MPFPVFMELRGRCCLVIGGGGEADRKAALLRRAGAEVRRATTLADELLTGVALVIIADARDEIAQTAARAARARGVLVNVVDRPQLCDFTVPAIVDRAPVVIAISTSGIAPGLAKALRVVFDRILPRRLGDLAVLAGRLRPLVSRRLTDPLARQRFWRRIFKGRVALLALAGRPASGALLAVLDKAASGLAGGRDLPPSGVLSKRGVGDRTDVRD